MTVAVRFAARLGLLSSLGLCACSGKLDLGHDLMSPITLPDASSSAPQKINTPTVPDTPTSSTCVGIPCFQGAVIDVATSAGAAKGLVMDADNVFWAASVGQEMMITPRDGGATMAAPTPSGGPYAVAADDTNVYFTSADGGYIAMMPKTTRARLAPKTPPPITILVSGQSDPESILVASEGIYFGDEMAGTVKLASFDGTSVRTLVSGLRSGAELALDDQSLYYVDSAGGEIHSIDRTSGVDTLLLAGLEHPVAPVVRDDDLYFLELGTQDSGYSDGRLARMPKSGGDATILLQDLDAPSGIAADTAAIYLCTRGTTENGLLGKIVRLGDDGQVSTLAVNQPQPFAIAVDGEALFWTTDANNTLRSIAR
ncbi:MAG TPA: hypothetical protein VHV51_18885 [Polyangiaceae bacterium]|jgi:sugar lactone lactonase YvrE|nr:hypothetical protein [Polyangiaceae bacterium]